MSTRRNTSDQGKSTNSTKRRATAPASSEIATTAAAPAPSAPAGAPAMARRSAKLTEKSIAKARAAFASFTLSKFPAGQTPKTHVAPGQDAASVQRTAVSQQLARAPSNGSMSFALSVSALKTLLPSYDPKAGTISLNDVIHALESNMRGNEFYSSGNPTLNRLAIQSQVQELIASIVGGTKK